jgi:hypothetical protein
VLLNDDNEDPFAPMTIVPVNYFMSAYGNIENYYTDKKRMQNK